MKFQFIDMLPFYGLMVLGTIEKKQSSVLSKKEKGDVTVHPTLIGGFSAKDASTVQSSYPLLPVENVNKDSDCAGESYDNEMPTKPEAVSAPLGMTSESDLQDMVRRASASEDVTPTVGHHQEDILVSTGNKPSKNAETSEDKLPENPHGPVVAQKQCAPRSAMAQKLCAPESKLIEPNMKHQDSFELPPIGNLSRALVIPEQTYIWQYVLSPSLPYVVLMKSLTCIFFSEVSLRFQDLETLLKYLMGFKLTCPPLPHRKHLM
jgi:hypothetical protein